MNADAPTSSHDAARSSPLAWVAPAVLLAVATVQLAASQQRGLSPWKGGGFGMFATVDSPAARFLRIRLLGPDRELPVLVPDRLRRAAHELRTTGSPAGAAALARVLAEGTWVELRLMSALRYYQRLLAAPAPASSELAAAIGRATGDGREAVDLGRHGFLRLLDPDERPAEDDVVFDLRGVRLELWRYAFDARGPALRAQPLIAPVVLAVRP
jgi:hypothetical protein